MFGLALSSSFFQSNTMKPVRILNTAVIVAALGYFVDIYDLLLFNMVRVDSLRDIGFGGRELEMGIQLHNAQMTGLMIGGIAWGMLGDKRGRLSVLFGSIFLYSIANLLNAYVHTFTEYAILRFIAGVGLAGELGAGITLVSEVLPPAKRGIGTMIVATIGVSGAVVGGWVAQHYPWRTAYVIGGVLGFSLLLLRIGVSESGIYQKAVEDSEQSQDASIGKAVIRGSFVSLFTHRDRFARFSWCILSGVPIWFTIGILVAYAPEFAKTFLITDPITTAKAVMYCYLGFVFGDFGSGLFSQFIKSRLKAIQVFIVLNAITSVVYLTLLNSSSADAVYGLAILLGTTGGYWAVVITLAAEQFGTNLRATVATAVPNFIRFSVVPMATLFLAIKGSFGLVQSAMVIGLTASGVAFFATTRLKETFGCDLNFIEKNDE
jgi:putative MFS transporter